MLLVITHSLISFVKSVNKVDTNWRNKTARFQQTTRFKLDYTTLVWQTWMLFNRRRLACINVGNRHYKDDWGEKFNLETWSFRSCCVTRSTGSITSYVQTLNSFTKHFFEKLVRMAYRCVRECEGPQMRVSHVKCVRVGRSAH